MAPVLTFNSFIMYLKTTLIDSSLPLMDDKTKPFTLGKLKLAFLYLFLSLFLIPLDLEAQSTCATAINIGSSGGDTAIFTGSDVWFKFQASDTEHQIRIGQSIETSPSLSYTIYSGTCGALNVKQGTISMNSFGDIVSIDIAGLTTNDEYFLKLNSIYSGESYVLSSTLSAPCLCIIPPDNCERVCNYSLENINPGSPNGLLSSFVDRACPWRNVPPTVSGGAVSSPDHWLGTGMGQASDGALGFVCGQNIGLYEDQEYAYLELETPIQIGEQAVVSYFIKTEDEYVTTNSLFKYAVDHFAAVLTPTVLTQNLNANIVPPAASIEVAYNSFIPLTWTQVTKVVTNNTGSVLSYLTLGPFETDANLNYSIINSSPFAINYAYALVDKISVTRLENCNSNTYCEFDVASIGFPNLPISGLTYVWRNPSGVVIPLANGPTYDFSSVGLGDSGVYELEISDGVSTYSIDFNLEVVECCDVSSGIKVPIENNSADYLINNLNGGSFLVSNQTVVINGNFMVDQSITFSNCTIQLGPNARMDLSSGTTLIINNNSLVVPCEGEMYDGIYADNESESIYFRSSTARGGKSVLNSYNNATLVAGNSDFEDNYIGIGVYDFQPATFPYTPSQIQIFGNEFTHSGSNLISPYSSLSYPFKCIDVKEVNELEIGGSIQNTFEDFQYGIYANTSEIEVYNAVFDQNVAPATLTKPNPSHAAIFCIGPSGSLDFFERAHCVVTNTNGAVTFTDNQVAIFARENYLACDNAIFNSNDFDIRMRDFDGADIWDNDFTGVNGISEISVSIQNATPRLADLDVYDNLFTSYKKAIEFWNVLGNGGSYSTKVYDNEIDFTNTTSAFRQGITAVGCSYSEIYDNHIEKTFGVTSVEADKLVGIRIQQTTYADVYENVIYDMGRAILGRSNISNTQFWCNTMNRYYEGWWFDNATVSNQLISGGVQENKWFNPIAIETDITGTVTTSPSLYRNIGTGLDPDQQSGAIFAEVVVSAVPPCGSGGGSGSSQLVTGGDSGMNSSSAYLAPPVQLSSTDDLFNNVQKAQINEDLGYTAALSNVQLTPNESALGRLYFSIQNDTVGAFHSAATAISVDTNTYFTETATIMDAYENYYTKGLPFPAGVENDLLAIAYQGSLAEYGPNVLSAWVMLDLDVYGQPNPKSNRSRNLEISEVLVYPNPTTGRIVIESSELFHEFNQNVSIELVDIFGKRVFSDDVEFSGNSYGFYIEDQPKGVYQLILEYNGTLEYHSIILK